VKPPPVEYVSGGWQTARAWNPRVNGTTLRIPAGYRTDLASVPRVLRGFVNTYELGGVGPPLIHDVIYQARGLPECVPSVRFTRRAADRLFRDQMAEAGVGWRKRWLAWAAVRVFGWLPWPPSRTTLHLAWQKSLGTVWQSAVALVAVSLIVGVPGLIWLVPPFAGGLSFAKSLMWTPVRDRVEGIIYE